MKFCKLDIKKATVNTILQQAIYEAIVSKTTGRYKYEIIDDNYTIKITGKRSTNPKSPYKIADELVSRINSYKPDILRVVKTREDDQSPILLEVYVNPDYINQKFDSLPEEQKNHVNVDLSRDINFFNGDNSLMEQERKWDSDEELQFQQSLNKPNTNPILQGNQQEQVKKFTELQERLNNKEFLEGAKNAFESSEELQRFGTQEQYNDYIARVSLGIVKNPSSGEYNYESRVKDIVYHRTNSDWFKTQLFSKNVKPVTGIGEDNKIPESQGAIYFYYKDKEGASNLTGKYIFPVILNIKTLGEYTGKGRIFNTASNKKILDDLENEIIKLENLANESQDLVLRKEKREQANKLLDVYNTLYDNNKIKQIAQLEEGQGLTYIKKWDFSYIDGITDYRWLLIPNPEQIHILGSKQDIEGFKEFVKEQPQLKDIVQITEDNKVSVDVLRNDNTNQDIKYQLSKEQSEGIIASEKTIRDLAARMSDRIGIPFRIISDRTQQFKGKIENNVAYVNLAYATLDSAPHEILAHPIIRALKNKSEKSVNSEIDKMIEIGIIKKEC